MALQYAKTSTRFLKLFTSTVLLLGLCLSPEAKKFDEAECRPRPAVVPVSTTHKYKPYHIVLYKCSGTFNKISPSVKICGMVVEKDVLVDVHDEHGRTVTLTLKNHTKCGATCATSSCGDGQIMDDCRCQCLTGDCKLPQPGVTAGTRNGGPKASLPLPYIYGMALVGIFAVFVLVFDAMLCVKKRGFMHTIKHSCCGQANYTDKNENQPYENQKMVTDEKKQTEV